MAPTSEYTSGTLQVLGQVPAKIRETAVKRRLWPGLGA